MLQSKQQGCTRSPGQPRDQPFAEQHCQSQLGYRHRPRYSSLENPFGLKSRRRACKADRPEFHLWEGQRRCWGKHKSPEGLLPSQGTAGLTPVGWKSHSPAPCAGHWARSLSLAGTPGNSFPGMAEGDTQPVSSAGKKGRQGQREKMHLRAWVQRDGQQPRVQTSGENKEMAFEVLFLL